MSSPPKSPRDCQSPDTPRTSRPEFHHRSTRDRLREGSCSDGSLPMISNIKKGRRSVFREIGLEPGDAADAFADRPISPPASFASDDPGERQPSAQPARVATLPLEDTRPAAQGFTTAGGTSVVVDNDRRIAGDSGLREDSTGRLSTPSNNKTPWYAKLATGRRPRVRTGSEAPPSPLLGLPTMTMLVMAVALVAPLLGRNEHDPASVADAGPILRRATSPTDVCARWAQQTAHLNGTLYIYGGEAKTTMDQENNTWNNDFLTLDLTRSWDTSSPSLTGLTQPDGPPEVALGYLWNDYNNLYLYGGEFADNPYVEPSAVSVWRYDIGSSAWTEYSNLVTTAGNDSTAAGVSVQRAAEGAGVSVPELGLSWYFGGHLDWATTPGWSTQTPRVYLKSLLEFTHPGYANDAISSLTNSGAPAQGAYRNVTQGGLQTSSGFGERADGVLIFVPGWGTSGVLIGLAGGTASDFTNDMSTLDVYDIASSQWYHQQTTGTAPGVRVNPCAVVASAPDASSFNIYLFGGQNLQPAGDQIQYDDMYILTIPSFTWIGPITQAGSSIPSARAGHTCNLRDGQMVVVGGFNTTVTTCDSPGIYVYNASSLEWASSFTRLSTSDDLDPGNSVLAASYGYTVPDEVVSVVGGNPSGSATVTTPAVSATGGPFATGKPPVYTITSAPTATITSAGGGGGGGGGDDAGASDVSGGLIAAVVVACLAGASAGYLGYCAWLYRRQVRAYKTHLAVTNRFPARSASHGSFGRMLAFGRGRKGSASEKEALAAAAAAAARGHKRDASGASSNGDESFGWVGRDNLLDPKYSSSAGSRPNPWGGFGDGSSKPSGSYGSGSGTGSGEASGSAENNNSNDRRQRAGSTSGGSTASSTDGLLEGQEPSFFSVIMGPRRALRVVNGLEGDNDGH